jgi:hypothetical protein
MKKILLLFLLILIKQVNAQTWQWSHNFGCANDSAYSNGVAHDSSGNCIITGSFIGNVDFDPTTGTTILSAPSYYLAFVSKYNSNGNLLWAFKLGASGQISGGNSVATDMNGNIFVTGYFIGTVDFDPGSATYNLTAPYSHGGDIFVAKYGPAGNLIWAFNIGGVGNYGNGGSCVSTDNSGDVFVTGFFQDTADFDPSIATISNLTAIGTSDIFIAKYDFSGSYLWAFNLGSTSTSPSRCQSISADEQGNVFASGFIESAIDFDPGPGVQTLTPKGYQDVFVAKYDIDGNYLWAFNIGAATHGAQSIGISADTSGNAFVTGFFRGTQDFDPGAGTGNITSHTGYGDIFLAKYDGNGNYKWAFGIGSYGANYNFGFSVSNDGSNPFITGVFGGVADFDPGPGIHNITSQGSSNSFLAKYDSTGKYQWAFNIGSSTSVTGYYSYIGYSVSADKKGDVWFTGWIQNSGNDFDPGPAVYDLNVPSGEQDIFIAKYNTATAVGIKEIKMPEYTISLYPNPSSNMIYVKSDNTLGIIIIYNALGEIVLQTKSKSKLEQIDVAKFPAGVYSVLISGLYIKFVKE